MSIRRRRMSERHDTRILREAMPVYARLLSGIRATAPRRGERYAALRATIFAYAP